MLNNRILQTIWEITWNCQIFFTVWLSSQFCISNILWFRVWRAKDESVRVDVENTFIFVSSDFFKMLHLAVTLKACFKVIIYIFFGKAKAGPSTPSGTIGAFMTFVWLLAMVGEDPSCHMPQQVCWWSWAKSVKIKNSGMFSRLCSHSGCWCHNFSWSTIFQKTTKK